VIKSGRNTQVGHRGETGKQEINTKFMENTDDTGHLIHLDIERKT
jgi:hypothetical protein